MIRLDTMTEHFNSPRGRSATAQFQCETDEARDVLLCFLLLGGPGLTHHIVVRDLRWQIQQTYTGYAGDTSGYYWAVYAELLFTQEFSGGWFGLGRDPRTFFQTYRRSQLYEAMQEAIAPTVRNAGGLQLLTARLIQTTGFNGSGDPPTAVRLAQRYPNADLGIGDRVSPAINADFQGTEMRVMAELREAARTFTARHAEPEAEPQRMPTAPTPPEEPKFESLPPGDLMMSVDEHNEIVWVPRR